MKEQRVHGRKSTRYSPQSARAGRGIEACATWRALYAGLEKLESELMERILLENNVLFPRVLNA